MDRLRKAAHEGPRQLLDALVLFPKRHPLAIAGGLAGIVAALLILGVWDARRDIGVLRPKVVQIEKADPCVSLSEAVKQDAGKKEIGTLSDSCIDFLNQLGPLVSESLACSILEAGAYPCPKPGTRAADRAAQGGEAQNPSNPGQQPGPSGGHIPPGIIPPGIKPPKGGPEPQSPGVSNPPPTGVGQDPPPSNGLPKKLDPPPVSASDDKPPLGPVVEQVVPPAAAPAVKEACEKAAAATVPIC